MLELRSHLYSYYNNDISATVNSRRGHNSFVHLVKELAVLSTSLPPGIWMRVDETRIDVIKVLIAGPEGTPYQGGLFEFDVFVPLREPALLSAHSSFL
jgi:baculoviral IAP repeat-containing protein 6